MKTEFIALLKEQEGKHLEGHHVDGFTKWLNGKLASISDTGDTKVEFEVRADMCNLFGIIHGGAISAIMDEIMGFQLFIKSEDTATYLAMNIVVDFVKSAKKGEILTAIPSVVRIGRKTANMSCELLNAQGVVIARSSSNFLRMT
ncbi:MAG: PaaI family thioesterase [Saprospiraceae bacterium]|nr:PaaI family thioesterase [Saprospiraceae bacterium]